ncbi:MAG: Flp pilus assembly protein CpaB [Kiritimatiellaeota bacterium]|nr:Flp pilus assembly protein CpaB [Kiritimatiellota bacterium]
MKNTIPLVIAVILGLAAVFAVSRMMKKQNQTTPEEFVEVVVAARDLSAREDIKEGCLVPREIPVSMVSKRHVRWNQMNMLLEQTVLRSIGKGDYVLINDVGRSRSLGHLVGDGDWAVPVTFSDYSLVQLLQPGDEIAILGTFDIQKTIPSADLSAPPVVVEERATSVLFPNVRILDIGLGDGVSREEGATVKTVVVAVPPQQAAVLIAAQQIAELYPALRRPNDTSSQSRADTGVVDETTFEDLRAGLKPVRVPAAPGKVAR